MVAYVSYCVAKKNGLFRKNEVSGETVSKGSEVSTDNFGSTTEMVTVVNTITLKPNQKTSSDEWLFPSGNFAYVTRDDVSKVWTLFYNNQQVKVSTGPIISVQEIGGKLSYIMMDGSQINSTKKQTLFYDGKQIATADSFSSENVGEYNVKEIDGKLAYITTNFIKSPLGGTKYVEESVFYNGALISSSSENYFENLQGFSGKIVYTTRNLVKQTASLFYDGKEVARANFNTEKVSNIHKIGDKISCTMYHKDLYKNINSSILFYGNKQITVTGYISYVGEIAGKLAYVTVVDDSYGMSSTLFYDNKPIATSERIDQVQEINGKLAYTSIDGKTYITTLFYDNKPVAKAKLILKVKEVGGKLVYQTLNKSEGKWTLFSDGKEVVTSDNINITKDIGGKLMYSTHENTPGETGFISSALFYDGVQMTAAAYSLDEAHGFPAFTTYDSSTKKYTLLYNNKKILSADKISGFASSTDSTSSPVYFYITDKKGDDTVYSVYKIN